jgi:RNA polymerase sigma-70 factor, ECF subfamily
MRDRLQCLYDQHAGALHAFLLNLMREESLAREVLQEVFIRLARDPSLLATARHERAYLLRLARNAAIDAMRRQEARDRYEEKFAQEQASLFARGADLDEEAFRLRLSAALATLPPEQREVVHLRLWEDLTFQQIGEALEIPLHTAASRYRYGLDKLRVELRPFYEEIK